MLAEHPVCRVRFVTARSVAAKCYGLVNLGGEGGGLWAVAGRPAARGGHHSRLKPLPKTLPSVMGHAVLQQAAGHQSRSGPLPKTLPAVAGHAVLQQRHGRAALRKQHRFGARGCWAGCFGADVNGRRGIIHKVWSRSGPLPKTFPAVMGHAVLQHQGARRPTTARIYTIRG